MAAFVPVARCVAPTSSVSTSRRQAGGKQRVQEQAGDSHRMRFWGCETSVSSGSFCSVMVIVVGGAAERQGRRQPEPERLYAVVQANSSCAREVGVTIGSVHVVAGRGRAIGWLW